MITVTQHEKNEWSRMAQAAYAADRNDVGHRCSGGAAMRNGEQLTAQAFDALQEPYRAWLCRGEWPLAPARSIAYRTGWDII